MNNIIKVTNENGETFEVEVLDIFEVAGYEGKEYIVYSRGKEIDNNVEVYVSILRDQNGEFLLDNITDDKEWEDVEKAMDEMGEVNE